MGNKNQWRGIVSLLPDTWEKIPNRISSIKEIIYDIGHGKYFDEVLKYRKALTNLGKKSAITKKIKEALPCFMWSGRFSEGKSDKNFQTHSQIVAIDIDGLTPDEAEKIKFKLLSCSISHAYLFSFLSPSLSDTRAGLKIGFAYEGSIPDKKTHKRSIRDLVERLKSEHITVTPDKAAYSLSRLCYMSYDPDAYYNDSAFDNALPVPPEAVPEPKPEPKPRSKIKYVDYAQGRERKQEVTFGGKTDAELLEMFRQADLREIEKKMEGVMVEGQKHFSRLEAGFFAGGSLTSGIITQADFDNFEKIATADTTEKEVSTWHEAVEEGEKKPLKTFEQRKAKHLAWVEAKRQAEIPKTDEELKEIFFNETIKKIRVTMARDSDYRQAGILAGESLKNGLIDQADVDVLEKSISENAIDGVDDPEEMIYEFQTGLTEGKLGKKDPLAFEKMKKEKLKAEADSKNIGSDKTAIYSHYDFHRQIDMSIDAMKENENLFFLNSLPVEIVGDEVSTLTKPKIKEYLSRTINHLKQSKKGDRPVFPSREVSEVLIERADRYCKPLRRVFSVPSYTENGTLHNSHGYNTDTETYLQGEKIDLDMSINEAIAVIDDLFIDFPFVDNHSKINCYAALIMPFVAEMVGESPNGYFPHILISAPVQSAGKTLLAKVLSFAYMGSIPGLNAEWKNDDGLEKQIISEFKASSPSHIIWDNIKRSMSSAVLDTVATSKTFQSRLLVTNDLMICDTGTVCRIFTSNNPALDKDAALRCLHISIDPKVENPDERTDFKHQDIIDYMAVNRIEIIKACITIIEAWISSGKLDKIDSLGKFPVFSRIVGNIIKHTFGFDILGNQKALRAEADSETTGLKGLLSVWLQETGGDSMKPAQVLEMIDKNEIDIEIKGNTDHGRKIFMGRLLRRNENAIFSLDNGFSYSIQKKQSQSGFVYFLVLISETQEKA